MVLREVANKLTLSIAVQPGSAMDWLIALVHLRVGRFQQIAN